MKILVTGGAGYMGCALVPQLNAMPEVSRVVVYDNLSKGDYSFFFGAQHLQKVSFVQGDILDNYKLEKVMQGIDVVIHLAAFVAQPFNHLQNLQYEQVNRWGTLSVVRCIQKAETVKAVLYMSSASVYGFTENTDAHATPTPENGYATSKLSGEQYMALLNEQCTVKILRAGNVFGFNTCLGIEGVLNTFMFDALVKNEIKIYGNGSQNRPFVWLQHVCAEVQNWVRNQTSGQGLCIDFNASLNELKDWLLTQRPELSYQYINQNQRFPSQSFAGYPTGVQAEILNKAWQEFEMGLRVKR